MRCRILKTVFLTLLLSAGQTVGQPAPEVKALRVILVGDSTMAPRTGYGDALCAMLMPGVDCINLARGGRSSASFRAEGLWGKTMDLLAPGDRAMSTWVLIQFGHNDQPGKPGRSTDLAVEFPANIERYVDDVKAAGAVPVLVTPLTRRIFRDGKLHNDLAPWAEATRRVAAAKRVPLIDLNTLSAEAVAAMGSAAADTLAQAPRADSREAAAASGPAGSSRPEPATQAAAKFDYTHLGAKGADFFARMLARQLEIAVPPLAPQLNRQPAAR